MFSPVWPSTTHPHTGYRHLPDIHRPHEDPQVPPRYLSSLGPLDTRPPSAGPPGRPLPEPDYDTHRRPGSGKRTRVTPFRKGFRMDEFFVVLHVHALAAKATPLTPFEMFW